MLTTKNTLIFRIIFVLLVVLFFVLKLDVCSLPYHWDELGVYSQAALYMYDHTPSLLPGDIPDVLSRGHPLLFMFIYACFFKLFGTSVIGVHVFTVLISILFIVISYRLAERFFSSEIALAASFLLVVQPLFFAQSVFVLPEIMLGVFALLSIYYYLDKKLWLAAFWASLALLTKETAIVLPLVMVVMEGLKFFRKDITGKQLSSALLIIFIPYYVFGIFIVIQRIQNGWFFYPYHTGFISFAPGNIYYRLMGYLKFLLVSQGRFTWLIVFLISIPVIIFRDKISFRTWITNGWRELSSQTFVNLTLLVYIAGIIGYSALNFPLQRYILLIYPILTIFVVSIVFGFAKDKKIVAYATLLLFGFINIFFMRSSDKMVENDMAYTDLLKIQQDISQYFDSPEMTKKAITADFPITPGFFDTRLGYVNQKGYNITIEVPTEFDSSKDYFVYTNPGNLQDKKIFETDQIELVKEFHRGAAEGYIYRVKR